MLDQRNCYRVMPGDIKSKLSLVVYLRHLFAYEAASKLLDGKVSVLEIGSGEGYGAAYLSEGPFNLTCYDLSESIAEHARATYSKSTLSFNSFNGKRIPEADNTFDAAISFQVIEHVPDVQLYLKEIYRVLKPGGVFLCSTPNRFYRLKPGQKPWNEFHLREYYDHELKSELGKVFKSAEVWGVRAKEELQQMEYDRVKKSKNSSPVKNIIPLSLRKWMKNRMRKNKIENNVTEDFTKLYSLNDYSLIKTGVNENSLDLFGYSVK